MDIKAFKACMEYLSRNTRNTENAGKLWCIIKRNRNASQYRPLAERYEDRPDTEQDLAEGRSIAKDVPALLLLHQNGLEENGWRGSPFWWPVMIVPKNTRPVIFANELIDVE